MAGWLVQKPVMKLTQYVIQLFFFVFFFKIYPFQPEILSPTFTHWVLFFGIFAIEMINPLRKHYASSISICIASV